MKKFNMSSKQIISWICINYGLFILAFFTLGCKLRSPTAAGAVASGHCAARRPGLK